MRTLLTGASGYIGLHILRALLDDGHQVTAVVRTPAKLGPFAHEPRVRIAEMDLVETTSFAELTSGHEVCVHNALLWGEPGSELDLPDTAVAAKLFDAAGSAGVSRCIYVSSVAVHRPFAGEMGENDGLQPTDVYGATKAAGELFLRAACGAHGMEGVVVRPGPVIGPPAFAGGSFRSHRRIGEMVTAAAAGQAIEVVRDEGRQLVDVATVARAIRQLTRIDDPRPTYLCVDRDVTPWERVARMVVGTLGASAEIRVLPRTDPGPVPRFRTGLLEGLLGEPASSEDALSAHIRRLVESRSLD